MELIFENDDHMSTLIKTIPYCDILYELCAIDLLNIVVFSMNVNFIRILLFATQWSAVELGDAPYLFYDGVYFTIAHKMPNIQCLTLSKSRILLCMLSFSVLANNLALWKKWKYLLAIRKQQQ